MRFVLLVMITLSLSGSITAEDNEEDINKGKRTIFCENDSLVKHFYNRQQDELLSVYYRFDHNAMEYRISTLEMQVYSERYAPFEVLAVKQFKTKRGVVLGLNMGVIVRKLGNQYSMLIKGDTIEIRYKANSTRDSVRFFDPAVDSFKIFLGPWVQEMKDFNGSGTFPYSHFTQNSDYRAIFRFVDDKLIFTRFGKDFIE